MTDTTQTATCRNCSGDLVFAPYFLDGREPNPPRWWHRASQTVTCSVQPKGDKHPTAEPVTSIERKRDMDALRAAVRSSAYTYQTIASRSGKTSGWVGEVLRGNYPYRGAYMLPKNIRIALEQTGFSVPESLWTF